MQCTIIANKTSYALFVVIYRQLSQAFYKCLLYYLLVQSGNLRRGLQLSSNIMDMVSLFCNFYLFTLYSRYLLSAQPLIGSFPQIPLPVLCWAAHVRYNSTTTIENSLQKNAAKQYKKLQRFFNYYFIAARKK